MNIPALLDAHRIPFRRHGESSNVTEGWVGLECVWCGRGTGKFGLGVHLRSGAVSCWKCGKRSLVDVLHAYAGLPYARAREVLGDVVLDRGRRDDAPRGTLTIPAGVGDLLPCHRRYLSGRGFDPDEIAEVWRVQGIGLAPRLAWRLFLPIHQGGEVVSWTTRAIGDVPHMERYRGANRHEEAVHRGDLLYGEQYAGHGVVVHEGQTDVWRTGPGAVCTAGVGFSRGQIVRLSRFAPIAICFDSDPAAQRRARELADALAVLSPAGAVDVVRLSGPDPATSPEDEIRELRKRYLE